MSEIEEMYKNVIEKQSYCTAHDCLDMSKCENCCFCKRIYPSFTAEKQIELIKWSARREPKVEIGYSSVCGYWVETPTDTRYYFGDQFDNALASLINNLWQDLTEEEKQQIKEILE